MNSEILKLKLNDFVKGAVTAVFAGFFVSIYSIVSVPDFNLFTVDWQSVLSTAFNAGVSAFVAYLAKNYFTDSSGKFMGRI